MPARTSTERSAAGNRLGGDFSAFAAVGLGIDGNACDGTRPRSGVRPVAAGVAEARVIPLPYISRRRDRRSTAYLGGNDTVGERKVRFILDDRHRLSHGGLWALSFATRIAVNNAPKANATAIMVSACFLMAFFLVCVGPGSRRAGAR